ncbi:MAG: LysR family transcriptional regulator [Desulfuromonadales bacterium]|nr:LysR family transcriptional regulator [Desulfuromonadales bacterium]
MGKKHRAKRTGTAAEGYRCRGRAWIEGRDGTFLGYGRVVLLERIRETGSISKAAKTMEMSYKHAWDLVDSMNRQAVEPLVEKVSGGRGGGGTRLTGAGERAVAAFWALHKRLEKFLAEESNKLDF